MPVPPLLAVAGPAARRKASSFAASALWGVAGVVLALVRPWPLAIAVDDAIAGHGRFGLPPTALLVAAGIALVVCTRRGRPG